jgi:hypothetical protein
MILKLIKGKPYRNYVTSKRGRIIQLASEPTGVFLPSEMHVCCCCLTVSHSLVSSRDTRILYSTRIENT